MSRASGCDVIPLPTMTAPPQGQRLQPEAADGFGIPADGQRAPTAFLRGHGRHTSKGRYDEHDHNRGAGR